jgi:hypothetical protein
MGMALIPVRGKRNDSTKPPLPNENQNLPVSPPDFFEKFDIGGAAENIPLA